MRAPLGVRTHFSCPACEWRVAWAFEDFSECRLQTLDVLDENEKSKDPDMGLIIGAHLEANHPELLYGLSMPTSVLGRVLALAGART